MIAWWHEDDTTEPIVLRGEWIIRQTFCREDIERLAAKPVFDEHAPVKGFRTPPINPGKRIRSPKRKKR